MTYVVGAHPQNLSLSILARRPQAVASLREKGLQFFVYAAGSQTIPLIKAGVLHLAGTGATPPILAKAEGLSAAVFGMSGSRPERGGLLVRADSGIHDLKGLVGKGIGLMPISWHTQFLATELDAAGLAWRDVRAAEILPATAKDAFIDGLLDAIVATDPLYAQIASRVKTRVLASPGTIFSNRSVYWGLSELVEDRAGPVRWLLDALIESDRAVAANPQEAAALLDGLNGNTAAQWLPALTSRPWGVVAPDDAFLHEQQRHADIFTRFGLIPRQIDVTDTVDISHFATA
ncbi:ABC transporter substrate-binding protein [Tardiphaga sp.]|uniref:ABC transporter substrate-binding protein n=1 Tax=Tardiphaga sp. TaxID=1926292 RepID=UPI00261E3A2A|nr:ABC transporter substrate-binding protein [Tardiphaga sp.]MDB5617722.1 NitT/TauT family transport system substrate-binding protein/sulfonate transport system [Tardiphaga sp.]